MVICVRVCMCLCECICVRPPHIDSVVYVRTGRCLIQPAATANLFSQNPKNYAILKKMPNGILGGVLDSGAQRGATGRKSEILKTHGYVIAHAAGRGPCKAHDWHSDGC